MATGVKPPAWFWIVALLLVLWEGFGVYLFVQQMRLGPDAMGPATDYQRALYASLPTWYNYAYAVAIFGSFLGALALLLKERRSAALFVISLIAMAVTFGYLFAATDVIAHQGPGQALGVPVTVVVITLFAIWLSRTAAKKGWIGR
jgi:uncharacterized membrane protein